MKEFEPSVLPEKNIKVLKKLTKKKEKLNLKINRCFKKRMSTYFKYHRIKE